MDLTIRPVPPESRQALRLMCLGDSITEGFWFPGGYRCALCRCISENGLENCVSFVGEYCGGNMYDSHHAGYIGFGIEQIPAAESISGARSGLTAFAGKLLAAYPADIVFLLIGTNDILSLYDLAHFGDRLEHLAHMILQALPENGALCIATLPDMDAADSQYISPYFFTPDSMDAAVADCNRQIRAVTERLSNAGKPVYLADINPLLTKADLYDGVHPNETGYEKIGCFFFRMLLQFLPAHTAHLYPPAYA